VQHRAHEGRWKRIVLSGLEGFDFRVKLFGLAFEMFEALPQVIGFAMDRALAPAEHGAVELRL